MWFDNLLQRSSNRCGERGGRVSFELGKKARPRLHYPVKQFREQSLALITNLHLTMMERAELKFLEHTDFGPADILFSGDIPRYTYEPLLGPDNIRILQLHHTNDRIECSIRQINVSDGDYQALSYVWGSPEKPFRAIVHSEDGQIVGYVPLTANLKNALCDLRDTEGVESKVFWVDQICIDQEGDEKNHQVAMMRWIYKNAAQVITYIGPAKDDDEEKVAMDLMEHLHQHFEANYELLFESATLRTARLRSAEFPVTRLPKELQDDQYVGEMEYRRKSNADIYVIQGWRRLCEIAFGEWTQRLWMVQEQILNDKTLMLRGSLLLPWERVAVISILFDVGLLPDQYYQRFWIENRPRDLLDPRNIILSIYSMWWNRRRKVLTNNGAEESDEFVSLLKNVRVYSELKCQDSRVSPKLFKQCFVLRMPCKQSTP